MVNPLLIDGIVYASLLSCLAIGFTSIIMTTRVWNIAYGSMVTFGSFITLTAGEVWKAPVYSQLYLSFIVPAIISLALYTLLLKPLIRRGASDIALFVLTFAFAFILLGLLNIYADYLTEVFKLRARLFFLRGLDIWILGLPGIAIFAPTLTISVIVLLHLFLTRTKFGTAMRASIENPSLAGAIGVNVNLVYSVSWFLAGGLAGLAGGLLPLWILCHPSTGDVLLLSIFAASLLGGVHSIYGAVLGGAIVGPAEVWGTAGLAMWLGAWVTPYRPLIPLLIMTIIYLMAPEGLTGINWREKWVRMRKRLCENHNTRY